MTVKVEWHGEAQQRKLRDEVSRRLNEAAESMVSVAKQLAPVDTGFMRDHISQTDFALVEHLRSEVTSDANYSLYVEYGTIHMDAQPFMTPAFESAKRQLASSGTFIK